LLRERDLGQMQELRDAAAERLRESEGARREAAAARADAELAKSMAAALEEAAGREATEREAERGRHAAVVEELRAEAEKLRADVTRLLEQVARGEEALEEETREFRKQATSAAEREELLEREVRQARADAERAAEEARKAQEALRGEAEAAAREAEACRAESRSAKGELEVARRELEANSSALLREGLRRRDEALAALVDVLGVRGRARRTNEGEDDAADGGSADGSDGDGAVALRPTTAAEVMVGDYETVRERVLELASVQKRVEEAEARAQDAVAEALLERRRADEAEERAASAKAEAEAARAEAEEAQADVAATELSYRAKEEERAEVAAQLERALAGLEQGGARANGDEGPSISTEEVTEVRAKLALLKAERDRLEGLLDDANGAAAASEAAMEDMQAQYLRRLDEASEEKRLAFLESQKLRDEIRLLRAAGVGASPRGASPRGVPSSAGVDTTSVASPPAAESGISASEAPSGGKPTSPLPSSARAPSVDEEDIFEGVDEGVGGLAPEDSIAGGSIIDEESAMYGDDDDFEEDSAPSSPMFAAVPMRRAESPLGAHLAAPEPAAPPERKLPPLDLSSRPPPPRDSRGAGEVPEEAGEEEGAEDDDEVASLENAGIRTDRSFVSVRSLAQEGSFVSDVSRDLTDYEGYDLMEEVSRPQLGGPTPTKGPAEEEEDDDDDDAADMVGRESVEGVEDPPSPDVPGGGGGGGRGGGPSWDARQKSIMAGSVDAWHAVGEAPSAAPGGNFLDLPEAREDAHSDGADDDDGYSPYVPDALDASRGYDFGMSVSEEEMEMSDADSDSFELPGI